MKYTLNNIPQMLRRDKRLYMSKLSDYENTMNKVIYVLSILTSLKLIVYLIIVYIDFIFNETTHVNSSLLILFMLIEIAFFVVSFFLSANYNIRGIIVSGAMQIICIIINLFQNPILCVIPLAYFIILFVRYLNGRMVDVLSKEDGFPYFYEWSEGGEDYTAEFVNRRRIKSD